MSYVISKSNGVILATIADQTFDSDSTALTLVGRGAVNYGPAFGSNFVYLMENFANNLPPAHPLVGQLWYDTSIGVMKVFVGANQWEAFSNLGGLGKTIGLRQGTTLAGATSSGVRIAGSTGYVLTAANGRTTTVSLTMSEGKVIEAISAETIPVAALPATITIQGNQLQLASRFPNGLLAGSTLATDPIGYVNAGLATSSLYADVAERYAADAAMEAGDVVALGGTAEITLSKTAEDTDVFGVISTAAAVRLNDGAGDDATHPLVALMGRVPCKVVGPVRKGQRIVSSGLPGIAKAAEGAVDPLSIIGRAVVAKTSFDIGLVEVVIGRS